jgi:hypothetical protein
MKIAVLMLVHKNIEQVERLIKRLKHDDIDIFIHVDKKCKFSPSDISDSKVIFTKKRFDVGLFEFSMVDAEMELIRTARQHGQYDYYLLLSGQCYPLMHIDNIYDFLSQQYPTPFIEIVPTDGSKFEKAFKHVHILKRFKLTSYSFLRQYLPPRAFLVLKNLPGGLVAIISSIKELFVKSPRARLKKMKQLPYRGPQWWILPDVIIDDIYPLFENKKFCGIISDCFSCDETFFQTAIMMNPQRAKFILGEKSDYRNKKTFTIFDGGHPTILTEQNYEQLISSNMLFARKFDINVDSKIMDKLDQDAIIDIVL